MRVRRAPQRAAIGMVPYAPNPIGRCRTAHRQKCVTGSCAACWAWPVSVEPVMAVKAVETVMAIKAVKAWHGWEQD